MKNTEPEFYEGWAREQLVNELCRLNKIVGECLIKIDEFLEGLKPKKG